MINSCVDILLHTVAYGVTVAYGSVWWKKMRKLSRSAWIAGSFEALSEGGIDALRVEPLAKRLGVTKGSFYHHFENRRDLRLALLGEWERLGTSRIIDDVSHSSSDGATRLRMLAHETMKSDPFTDSIETGIRSWAAVDVEVSTVVARVDRRRLGFTEGLFSEVGLSRGLAKRRSLLLYRVLIGEFMWRTSGGPTMSKREIDEFVDQLLVVP